MLFTSDGIELWRRRLSGNHAGQIEWFDNPFTILASSYTTDSAGNPEKHTELFDRQGNKIFSFSALFEKAVKFGNVICLAYKHKLLSIAFPAGKVLWKWQAPPENFIIDIMSTNKGLLIFTAQNEFRNERFEYFTPTLYHLKESGVLLAKQQLGEVTFIKPSLFYQRKLGLLSVGSIYETLTYDLLNETNK